MLFKKPLLEKIIDGSKTQTRRTSKQTYKVGQTYGVTCRRYQKSQGHIQILNAKQPRLGDITQEDVKAEGFQTLDEFKETWIKINGEWNLNQLVTAYEFRLCPKTDIPLSAGEPLQF
jgi:hypothetical protein